MLLHGKKTYLVSLTMALLGILVLVLPTQATWADPSASTGLIVGILMIALAASTAAIRHSLYRLSDQITKALRKDSPL